MEGGEEEVEEEGAGEEDIGDTGMTFNEVRKDLFTVGDDYHLAHCVASDLRMGKGIAVPMNAKFGLRNAIRDSGVDTTHPTCIMTGRVFNLITKARSYQKPLFDDLRCAVYEMGRTAAVRDVKKIAMPRIGCGLDGLDWAKVSEMVKECFEGTDVEILVCVWG